MNPAFLHCLTQALDPLDSMEMLAEADDGFDNCIVYMNPAALATLDFYHRQLNPALRGADVRTALGHSIHQFHAEPERVRDIFRQIMANPGLVHKTHLNLGEASFILNFSAVRDESGEVAAFHASWRDETAKVLSEQVTQSMTQQSNQLAHDLNQIRANMQKALGSVDNSVQNLTTVVNSNRDSAEQLKHQVNAIGHIAKSIRDIANQTNLLALNAAIEAARAGEYGRGFAVVADEVRSLSKRVQDATEQVQDNIATIQTTAVNIDSISSQAARQAADAQALLGDIGSQALTLNRFAVETTIVSARISHEIFVSQINRQLTEAIPSLSAGEITDHHGCAFGRWYDGVGKELLGGLPEFRAIEDTHARVHALGKAILVALGRGDRKGAQEGSQALEEAAEDTFSKLDRLYAAAVRRARA